MPHRRVVLKVGTNLLTAGTTRLDRAAMARIAGQVATLRERGDQTILVSSGAIAAGRARLGDGEAHRDVRRRQVLAAVGQSRLMALWDALFEARGVTCAQALLTRADLSDRLGYLNARNTLLALLELGVVPIVNENDVVSVEEIEDSAFGDNDNLSAQVANLVDADLLLMLTDAAGLYTTNPKQDHTATLIETVEVVDDAVRRAAAGSPGARGTGGMATKVEAARTAMQSGTHVVIADGRVDGIVLRAVAGERVGTHFVPRGTRLESRRRYLLSGLPVRGSLTIDDGAARAIEGSGTSLLPVGVVEVAGEFQRGDLVRIQTSDGRHVASGVSNYSAEEVARIRGQRSQSIAELLGHQYGEEVVHRNNLALA
ncbi:MAG: glutamate 5-kinase [Dehalococcoidia bacterium]|nr:glutamate 5-kinase [Dehalococcoidia bacterium]